MCLHHVPPRHGNMETRSTPGRAFDRRAERDHTRIQHRLDEIRIDPLVRQPGAHGLSRIEREGAFIEDNLATEHALMMRLPRAERKRWVGEDLVGEGLPWFA
jgi:hypothetical protein